MFHSVESPEVLHMAAGLVESGPLVSFAWIMGAACLAPLLSWLTGKRIPAVVLLIAFGIIIGPHWLDLANTEGGVGLVKELGLGMLFLLAGYEIDPTNLRSKEGRSASSTWIVCMVLSFAGAYVLLSPENTATAIVLAIAVTSTAVGTLMPIMKQQEILDKPVGKSLLVHGALGEIFPILAMALLLSARATWMTASVLLAFFLIAAVVAAIPKTVKYLVPWMGRAMVDSAGSTNQTVVRLVIWLLGLLMAIAAVFELDVVLGAFAAGFILRQIVPEKFHTALEQRLDIVGYGLLIPVFFVCSGMGIDPAAVIANPLILIALVPLIYITRGLPILLRELFVDTGSKLSTRREKVQLSLYAATALPIIVAVTDVAVASDVLSATNASLLVAAGSVTVLLFPLIAHLIQPAAERSKL
ncbi:cation:proton antiporter [Corynebacterium felinum]|uniref:Kef-type K+ transport system membrane component KefB n=2 Tax=Corynebacterium felinum TaxID=131318 RepID=A0ABU2BCB5_9CORY|nr:cation:proton antiporter [Corynebacterium felinum]MDF5820271.1 cation:proton antiporter [Corynebacterium felinum]MDR7355024.1 Kef-type K+ transport system membrane component KefB [Corynebacterium felinum]